MKNQETGKKACGPDLSKMTKEEFLALGLSDGAKIVKSGEHVWDIVRMFGKFEVPIIPNTKMSIMPASGELCWDARILYVGIGFYKGASVSVGFTYKSYMMHVDEPMVEIYPSMTYDNERFLVDETEELSSAIQRSLQYQVLSGIFY